ncbi:acetyl-CoA carboxylase biotin carboxylase subunit [Sporosarcina sp. ACRSL]|uniref:acetyl-CoA carboxylase biotin carboxylase subunit n=1 Tax=Sporosarcina sp. ACRSL TaxID=2918215 RepID=UPI001EF56270|nr:acetyl-CoA carboxylase biotin carboxylase subunit [Sporosarcina sp. ACRSL]MCG7344146.1 acetyl-CoA carboxylase biotin carboxylase subunit [Sporosarcina sp. ACRSL]
MIKKVLIANRGEIAVRIIRTCRDLGIKTVAVYSEADRDALHVQLSDEAYCLGPAASQDSYLRQDLLIHLSLVTKCDAIHPGYGFLSENDHFAEMCEQVGIIFIGPSSAAIRSMGVKDEAKLIMKQSNVPVVQGSEGLTNTVDEAIAIADRIGYPLIIKATAGGGGKGIRLVYGEDQLIDQFQSAKHEASSVFNNGGVYIEKYIEHFRHIEVQIAADQFGNTIHLGERDCTTQRRMQKLIEEAPSPVIDEELRLQLGEAAVRAAKAVNYVGVGTVEFIYDSIERQFYFMEMNTRLQVEHTITEEVTGVDLVELQFRIANGEPLPYKQEDINWTGWSIECRINAEDPLHNFMPNPGPISFAHLPAGPHVRTDSAIYTGYTIPPYYDSMIAKVIVHGSDRTDAIHKMIRALKELRVEGVPTTKDFLLYALQFEEFQEGNFRSNLYEKIMDGFNSR